MRLSKLFYHLIVRDSSVSLCMVCAYVREDYPRALGSGLSPVHTHNHTITAALLPQYACALCAIVRYLIFTQRCNNTRKASGDSFEIGDG